MMALGKPTPHTKFEDASFSHCTNIEGKPSNFRKLSYPRLRPPVSLGVILWWPLANPSRIPNLKSLVLAIVEILKGNPQMLGSFPTPGPRPPFPLGVILWWLLANSRCIPNLKSLASAVAEILKANSKYLGNYPSSGPRPLFLCVWFYDGPWQIQAA